MKQKVKYSRFSNVMTAVMIALWLIGIIILFWCNLEIAGWLAVAALAFICVSSLLYVPVSISSDEQKLTISRLLLSKSIPVAEIQSVEPYQPSLTDKKLCGGGACFGFWGWFSNKETGRYFASYGDPAECFLITLKNGRKYVLGCENSAEMAKFVQTKINA